MNTLDIIPPDFKLTGLLTLFDGSTIEIVKQRRIIPKNYKINIDSPLTAYMQLNIPEGDQQRQFFVTINTIPDAQMQLFVAGLGRKDYMDEILLCVSMNTTDKRQFTNVISLLYLRLQDIINNVMVLSTGARGSRRPIYQHYFYSKNPHPKKNDAILSGLIGINLTTLNYGDSLQVSIDQLRNELVALNASEDIPVLDLIDITLEQFNQILKLLPKESTWIKTHRDRQSFFGRISADLENMEDVSKKVASVAHTYHTLMNKFEQNNITLSELQAYSELIKKATMTTMPQKIHKMITTINVFTSTYNVGGILKYRGTTLARPSSIINDLLNSQFMEFLQTFKNQHKRMLIQSIGSKIDTVDVQQPNTNTPPPPPPPSGGNASSESLSKTTSSLIHFNDVEMTPYVQLQAPDIDMHVIQTVPPANSDIDMQVIVPNIQRPAANLMDFDIDDDVHFSVHNPVPPMDSDIDMHFIVPQRPVPPMDSIVPNVPPAASYIDDDVVQRPVPPAANSDIFIVPNAQRPVPAANSDIDVHFIVPNVQRPVPDPVPPAANLMDSDIESILPSSSNTILVPSVCDNKIILNDALSVPDPVPPAANLDIESITSNTIPSASDIIPNPLPVPRQSVSDIEIIPVPIHPDVQIDAPGSFELPDDKYTDPTPILLPTLAAKNTEVSASSSKSSSSSPIVDLRNVAMCIKASQKGPSKPLRVDMTNTRTLHNTGAIPKRFVAMGANVGNFPPKLQQMLGNRSHKKTPIPITPGQPKVVLPPPPPPVFVNMQVPPEHYLVKQCGELPPAPIQLNTIVTVNRRDVDRYVTALYDYKERKVLPLTETFDILKGDKYYYHGTNICSAINIMIHGFQKSIQNSKVTGSMLGDGVYLSDNIEKTIFYGDIVFVCELELGKILNYKSESEDFVDPRTTSNEQFDTIFYEGKYNRKGELVRKDAKRSRFNEFCVSDPKNINIRFIIKLDERGLIIDPIDDIICVYDIKYANYFLGFGLFSGPIPDKPQAEKTLNELLKSHLYENEIFYLKMDIATIMYAFACQIGPRGIGGQRFVLDSEEAYTFSCELSHVNVQDTTTTVVPTFSKHYIGARIFTGLTQIFKKKLRHGVYIPYYKETTEITNKLDITILNQFELSLKPKMNVQIFIDPHILVALNYKQWHKL
jgi:hypothetical protein